jgi:hypothetical protein
MFPKSRDPFATHVARLCIMREDFGTTLFELSSFEELVFRRLLVFALFFFHLNFERFICEEHIYY